MSTPTTNLLLEPHEKILFEGPFSEPKIVELKLTNTEEKAVAYKVKCTNNARFKIRPVMGLLEPVGEANATVIIQITCQPFECDEKAKARKERIVVLSIYSTQAGDAKARSVWAAAAADKLEPKHQNIPVEFRLPGLDPLPPVVVVVTPAVPEEPSAINDEKGSPDYAFIFGRVVTVFIIGFFIDDQFSL